MGYYDEISEGYEELHKEEQLKKIRIIKKKAVIREKDKLLDVGCGTGITIEPWECKRYGIDPAPKLLEKARQKSRIDYKLAAAEELPFEDDSFDIVISITAIQNFRDIRKGLEEIKRVGKRRFVLSFLKRSAKADLIGRQIRRLFDVDEVIEEEKDMIYIIGMYR